MVRFAIFGLVLSSLFLTAAESKAAPAKLVHGRLTQNKNTGEQRIAVYLEEKSTIKNDKSKTVTVTEIPVIAQIDGNQDISKNGWLIISDLKNQKLTDLFGEFTYTTSIALGWLPLPVDVDLNAILMFESEKTNVYYSSAMENLSFANSWKSRVKKLTFKLSVSVPDQAQCRVQKFKVEKKKDDLILSDKVVACDSVINKTMVDIATEQ